MNYRDQLTKIRRFLRDPNGNLWDDAYLKTAFNNAQRDLQRQVKYLENVQNIPVPDFYQMSYMHDWEWAYLPSSQTKFYRCLRYYDQSQYVVCNRWEIQVDYGSTGIEADGGHFTQPWEAWYLTPGEPVRLRFPEDFHEVKVLAYDYEPMPYVDISSIMDRDPDYTTRQSEPYCYYRPDALENEFVLYPLPSSVTYTDYIEEDAHQFAYTFDWESSYGSGSGIKLTRTDSDNSREYLYIWEVSENQDLASTDDKEVFGSKSDYGMRATYRWEVSESGAYGQINFIDGDTVDSPIGAIVKRTDTLFSQDEGVAISAVDTENNVLLIYEVIPEDIIDDTDISQFPEWMQKYIECSVTEKAYGSNTDGRIQSLADYWAMRYQVGVSMIKRYKSLRRADRNYAMVTPGAPPRQNRRLPRLPDEFPA